MVEGRGSVGERESKRERGRKRGGERREGSKKDSKSVREQDREEREGVNYGKLAASRGVSNQLWQDTTERMRLNPEKCRVITVVFFKTKKMSNDHAPHPLKM
jgi:hypothetical protein